MVWKKNFGGNGVDKYNSVTTVSDGIIAVGSSLSSFGNGDWAGITEKGSDDAIIVKYDNNGNVVWKKNFGGISVDVYHSVTAVSDGIIAVGSSDPASFGNGDWTGITGKGWQDAIIIKYDNSGNVVWKKSFGGSSEDYYYSVTTVSDGIIAVGNSENLSFGSGDWTGVAGKGNMDAIIVKYEAETGQIIDCEGNMALLQNQLNTANNTIVTLQSQIDNLQTDTMSLNTQKADLLNQLGTANSTISTLQTQNTTLQGQINIANGTIGILQTENTDLKNQLDDCDEDKVILQALLDECLSGSGLGSPSVRSVSLQVYPNPVQPNGVLNINNETIKAGNKLEIFDMNGKLVATHSATGVETSINIGYIPQGMYLLRSGRNGVKFEVK